MKWTAILENRRSSDDLQLTLTAQKGDLGAFNELVLTYQEAVYNLAYRILGDPASAEDITQDVFLIAYRSLSGFRNGSFRSWLFRITTNACYDELRRLKRHPVLPIESGDRTEEDLAPLDDWPGQQLSPEQWYARHELEQNIQQALNLIDPDQRAVVALVDLQALDYQEAAQVLHIPLGTVKSRLARGRERLRRIIIHRDI